MKVTRILSKYLIASRHEDLPREVVHEASRALLNWLGCAIGASRHETVDNAVTALQPFFGPAQAQLMHVVHALGSTERPMSDADLEEKFRGLVGGVNTDAQASQVITLCWQFPTLADAA